MLASSAFLEELAGLARCTADISSTPVITPALGKERWDSQEFKVLIVSQFEASLG